MKTSKTIANTAIAKDFVDQKTHDEDFFYGTLQKILSAKPVISVKRIINNVHTHYIKAESWLDNTRHSIEVKISTDLKGIGVYISAYVQSGPNNNQTAISKIMFNTIIQVIEDYSGQPISEISLDLLKYLD
jgi:hypothetical protein